MKIYVAGPFLPTEMPKALTAKLLVHACYPIIYHNVEAAIRAGAKLLEMGHNPYIPHLTYYTQMYVTKDLGEKWYDIDNDWLDCCDAILMIGDWEKSKGAMAELARAKKRGMIEYYSIDQVSKVN